MAPADFRSRLVERGRAAAIDLPAPLVDRLVAYYELLERWNQKINLTSLVDEDAAIDRLLLEPVAAAAYLPDGGGLLDVGSGGGSPAIPMVLVRPRVSLVMVESRSRKAAFLREAIRELKVPKATVETARAEDLGQSAEYRETLDVVSMRAVRVKGPLLTTLGSFLRPGGLLLVFRASPGGELYDSWLEAAPSLRLEGENPLPGPSAHLVRLRKGGCEIGIVSRGTFGNNILD